MGVLLRPPWPAFNRGYYPIRPSEMLRGEQHDTLLCIEVCTTGNGEDHEQRELSKCGTERSKVRKHNRCEQYGEHVWWYVKSTTPADRSTGVDRNDILGCWGPCYTMSSHAALGVVRAGVAVLKGK